MSALSQKNILIISPEAWGTSFLSKHFYARALARQDNKVFFLQPSGFPPIAHPLEVSDAGYQNLTVVSDVVLRGLRLLPAFLQKLWMRYRFQILQKQCGCRFDIVWSFDNSRYFFLDIPDAMTIHHVMDTHMNYHLREAASSAQLCFGVTHEIVDQLKKYNPKTYFVQHAWDPPTFQIEPIVSLGNEHKVAYMGNLLMPSFDAELMLEAAHRFSDVSFILIGSYRKGHLNLTPNADRLDTIGRLKKCSNVIFTDEITPEQAFGILRECDVLTLLYFNVKGELGNSSKLMSYLATGKVVISNTLGEFKNSTLLRQVSDRQQWLVLLGETLQNLSHWNSATKMLERSAFAAENTYERRLQEIAKYIHNSIEA